MFQRRTCTIVFSYCNWEIPRALVGDFYQFINGRVCFSVSSRFAGPEYVVVVVVWYFEYFANRQRSPSVRVTRLDFLAGLSLRWCGFSTWSSPFKDEFNLVWFLNFLCRLTTIIMLVETRFRFLRLNATYNTSEQQQMEQGSCIPELWYFFVGYVPGTFQNVVC